MTVRILIGDCRERLEHGGDFDKAEFGACGCFVGADEEVAA